VLNLVVYDDNLPELAESFQVALMSAKSADRKPGSTPTSGASIDPNNSDSKGILEFLPGDRFKFINVTIVDNPVPELEKVFRVELYNADGGARITVTIAASDDAHGVFDFSPQSLFVNGTEPEDGLNAIILVVSQMHSLLFIGYRQIVEHLEHFLSLSIFSQVDRSFGDLSNVTVYWEVDPSSEGELVRRFGNISFGVGQKSENIVISVAQDEIPELDKSYPVSLVNVSKGRLGVRTSATLTVLASDYPYGVFVFANVSRSIRFPEADVTVFLPIRRLKGTMGQVCPVTINSVYRWIPTCHT
ncbi:hypothetical protein XENOCAPTIV_014493, partial [Xenoophorus captivus]